MDELEDGAYVHSVKVPGDKDRDIRNNDIGVSAIVGGKGSGFTYQITGSYDTEMENGAVRVMGTVGIGPGTLGLAAVYASGNNSYYRESEWAVAAEYAVKATDKLKITPGIQYFGNWTPKGAWGKYATEDTDFSSVDMWKAGVTVDYQIVENFNAKATVNWQDHTSVTDSKDSVSGFFRLQRSF